MQNMVSYITLPSGINNSAASSNVTGSASWVADAECDEYHFLISRVVVAVAVLAVLANTALACSMAKLKENKTCRMFWFLWHLSIADTLLAIPFLIYHCRRLLSCPYIYQ